MRGPSPGASCPRSATRAASLSSRPQRPSGSGDTGDPQSLDTSPSFRQGWGRRCGLCTAWFTQHEDTGSRMMIQRSKDLLCEKTNGRSLTTTACVAPWRGGGTGGGNGPRATVLKVVVVVVVVVVVAGGRHRRGPRVAGGAAGRRSAIGVERVKRRWDREPKLGRARWGVEPSGADLPPGSKAVPASVPSGMGSGGGPGGGPGRRRGSSRAGPGCPPPWPPRTSGRRRKVPRSGDRCLGC